jgi:hypothetical protein
MARSCFKIITCAGDGHDLDSPKGKGSFDKRGWSFRKKSSKNQAINNTVILEAPPVSNNQISQSTPFNFDSDPNSTIEEKIPIIESTNDITNLSTPVSPTLSEIAAVTKEDDNVVNPDDSVIIIQTGVRRFLAEVEVLKQKNIVKLQAAVRGHLVRRHAVGTLRCVLAIVRMQALVRTHQQSKLPQKRNHRTQRPTYVSIERLLSNKFAKQLLESTPRDKSINIKCDPSRSDTAWKWLERWMAVSPGLEQSPNLVDNHDIKNQVGTIATSGIEDQNLAHREKSEFHPIQTTESESVSDKPGLVAEQSETEGRKSTSLSRKSSNPAFIAAQSKFEELTSARANKDSEAELLQSISKLIQIGSSECGTELSVTSTLDSPDQSEIEPKKIEIEAEVEPTSSIKNEESASPRSHLTVFESQGTPSSQLSTKARKPRDHKKPGSNPNSNSNPKRKSLSGASKKSPINVSQDSSGNSFEITGKRRISLGSPRTDGEQQEPLRDFSSLPSYMQATESAKAKALANNSSPRSSPDVQGKEFLIKKRHSLPVSNGRQESPRIQRSMSQAHQTVKGNGSNSQEKKWQR